MAAASPSRGSECTKKTDVEHFRLLDLPTELWIKIGKLAIDDSPTIETRDILRRRLLGGHSLVTPKAPLMGVCRTLRKELLPYYVQSKTSLEVALRSPAIADVGDWARSLAPSTRTKMTGVGVFTGGREEPLVVLDDRLSQCWRLKVKLLPSTEVWGMLHVRRTGHFTVKFLE